MTDKDKIKALTEKLDKERKKSSYYLFQLQRIAQWYETFASTIRALPPINLTLPKHNESTPKQEVAEMQKEYFAHIKNDKS